MASKLDRAWDKSRPPSGLFTLNRDSPLAQGLISWYPLGRQAEGRLLDRAGMNHATLTNGRIRRGDWGQPVYETATGEFATIADAASLEVTSLSISAIVTPASMANYRIPISRWNEPANDRVWNWAIFSGGDFHWYTSPDGTTALQIQGATLVSGQTYRICTTNNAADGTTGKRMFFNGAKHATTAAGTSLYVTGTGAVQICASPAFAGAGYYFLGQMSNIALWNRGLTDDEALRTQDPGLLFELWYPLRSPKWFLDAPGGGGGFKAAWASQRSRVIGAGVI